jgi:Zn-dependent M28 family amino/carboxypeptidase
MWAAVTLHAQQPAIRDSIAAIGEGSDAVARRRAITDQLDALKVSYHLEEFSFPNYSGTNVVADIPAKNSTAKTFLLGAHYDRVAQGQGVVDNGASCVVLLRLLAQFKLKPLDNYSVRAVFFDLEERGLVGSQAYFAKHQSDEKPALAMNFDVFGYGDTFFAFASSETGPLATALQQAAKQSTVPVRLITSRTQYPASDHRIMAAAGVETIGLALIDGSEIDAILQSGGTPPRVLTIIHTPADSLDKIRSTDIEKALPAVEQTIRLIDGK